ncbi:MAG: hypothetical protein AB7E37_04575 [Candidatus Altimarinota bacterium]
MRIIRTSDNSILGTFSQTLNCSTTSGSSSSTPNIDEDCNGSWDNSTYYTATYQSGTNPCGAYGTTYCHQYNPDGNCGHWVTPCIATPIYDYYYVYTYY